MASRRKAFTMDHPVIVLFVIVAVVASMALAAEVLKPLALSVLLAFALTPFARFLEHRRVPRVAAVVLTVAVALGGLSAIGYVVAGQLDRLAGDIANPETVDRLKTKMAFLNPEHKSNLTRATNSVQEVAATLQTEAPKTPVSTDGSEEGELKPVQDVRVIEQPKYRERLEAAVGPYVEALTIGSFVLILVLFLMVGREDLGNRIVTLFGRKQLSLTTRTMNEVAGRISRFLATNALVNACFGLIIGLGLHFLGVPYAVLWGVMAALLRFVPYVGTVIAFSMPAMYSVATSPGWSQVLWFLGLFLLMETALNSFLEPIIYGKTTGVSALGLLVAAMFWTWLWGVWGLLLSTPMTVCLAVLGKYVPSLGFFATLLGEDSELAPDVRYYQYLLALDQDGAGEFVDEFLKGNPRVELFEEVLIPALSAAERDFARGEIDEREQAYIWRVTSEILDELEASPEITLQDTEAPVASGPPIAVLGVPANDRSDALVLRMLGHVVGAQGRIELTIAEEGKSPLDIAAKARELAPRCVLLSHLPPAGLTHARYQVKRLKAGLEGPYILVGRWGQGGDVEETSERLKAAGADDVAFSLTEVKDRLLSYCPASQVADDSKIAKAPALA